LFVIKKMNITLIKYVIYMRTYVNLLLKYNNNIQYFTLKSKELF